MKRNYNEYSQEANKKDFVVFTGNNLIHTQNISTQILEDLLAEYEYDSVVNHLEEGIKRYYVFVCEFNENSEGVVDCIKNFLVEGKLIPDIFLADFETVTLDIVDFLL